MPIKSRAFVIKPKAKRRVLANCDPPILVFSKTPIRAYMTTTSWWVKRINIRVNEDEVTLMPSFFIKYTWAG